MKSATLEHAKHVAGTTSRVARHRKKVATSGAKRVEVTVPSRDAPLVKAIAGVLRSGGDEAERLRDALQPALSARRATTGPELVAFFRASPFVDAELEIERDRSTGRTVAVG